MTLRTIVKKHLEEETLKEHFKAKYPTVSATEKNNILKLVESEIERKIDTIINSFMDDLKKGSPESRRERTTAFILATLTLVATTGLAHAVNILNTIYICIMIAILLIIQFYQIYSKW